MAYATETSVPISQSKAEIERLLEKNGADQFMSAYDENRAMIQFRIQGRHIRFTLLMPREADFRMTPTRYHMRSPSARKEAWEKAKRARWRALLLCVKAKLATIESGIASFEEEFLAYTVLPDNSTVAEFMLPQVEQAYLSGDAPKMLPFLEG